MKKRTRYVLFTVVLTLGLIIFMNGSRLIIRTYQRESVYIETVRIGHRPQGDYEKVVLQRGLKDGLLHVLLQVSGIGLALFSGIALSKNNSRSRE